MPNSNTLKQIESFNRCQETALKFKSLAKTMQPTYELAKHANTINCNLISGATALKPQANAITTATRITTGGELNSPLIGAIL
jgi:hypothetical protein